MKNQKHFARLLGCTVAFVGVLALGRMARADVVYDNSQNITGTVFTQSGYEFGDDVVLGGGLTHTYITNFSFEYYGANFSGNETMDFRVYLDNGPVYGSYTTPGDMVYDSGAFSLPVAATGANVSFTNGILVMASNFTWTVTFGGIEGGESAGLVLNSTASFGSGFADYWERSGTNASLNDWVDRADTNSGVAISFAALAQGATVTDTTIPTVTLKVPANNAKYAITNAGYTTLIAASGVAAEKGGAPAIVFVRSGNGNYIAATDTHDAGKAAYSKWTVPASLQITYGSGNLVMAKALNKAGVESKIDTNAVTLKVFQNLTVAISQPGGAANTTVGSPVSVANGQPLEWGKGYKITGTPDANSVFSNWVYSVDGGPFTNFYTIAKLPFVMTNDLSLIANFSANRFLAQTGSYNGLFIGAGSEFTNSGYFTVKVSGKQKKLPSFTAKFTVAGHAWSGSGTFDLNGVGHLKKPIHRKTSTGTDTDLSAATTVVNLGFDGSVSGTVGDVGNWTSTLDGGQLYKGAAYDTNYTLVVPSFDTNHIGDGWGTLAVSNGVATLNGALADNTTFKQGGKVNIHSDGRWPLFVGSDKLSGFYTSEIFGWVNVTNSPYSVTTAGLKWIKRNQGKTYTGAGGSLSGFTNTVSLTSSTYANPGAAFVIPLGGTLPNNGGAAVQITEYFDNGGITGTQITNAWSMQIVPASGKNKFSDSQFAKANKALLSVNSKTGQFTTSFKDGGTIKCNGKGVALTDVDEAHGYFLKVGALETGSWHLAPQGQ